MLGSAIGFANLLGFGSQSYKNGGGAFLIPFFIALFILGIPMLMLEGIIGQKREEPLVTAYGRVMGRPAKILGWLAVFAVMTIGAFYTVLTGWSIAYTYFAATGGIGADTAAFFSQEFLKVTPSLSEIGGISYPVIISTLFVGCLGWYVLSRNIQSGIEKWCSIFLPLLIGLIIVFTAVVCFLPGSFDGFYHYLYPDFTRLYDLTIWRDVFGQLFFSLSLGLGIVVGYSRHTEKKTDIRQAMLIVALSDFAISFLSGLMIFGCLGFMSQQQDVAFNEVVTSHSTFEIGYVIFPLILNSFGPIFSRVIGVLFFFSVFIAGFTGVFSIIESIVGNLRVEFSLSRKMAATVAMIVIFILSIPFCMGNGTALIAALEPMVLGNNMLIGAIAQIIVFMYVSSEFRDHPIWMKGGRRVPAFYALKYVSLAILIFSLLFSIRSEYLSGFGLAEAIRFGWLAIALCLAAILSLKNPR